MPRVIKLLSLVIIFFSFEVYSQDDIPENIKKEYDKRYSGLISKNKENNHSYQKKCDDKVVLVLGPEMCGRDQVYIRLSDKKILYSCSAGMPAFPYSNCQCYYSENCNPADKEGLSEEDFCKKILGGS